MRTSLIAKFVLGAVAWALLSGAAIADKSGYLVDSRGEVVRNSYGQCWRTGYWTPAMAIAECDPDLVKKEAPPIVKPPAPPAPIPVMGPEKPAFEKMTFQAETLFDFDKAVVRPDGKQKLDEVVGKMKDYPQVEVALVTGHADRIGTEAYNMKLSQRRADAVKAYLVGQGVDASRIETAARGESEPVVSCKEIKGKEHRNNKKLVACLQPNRRVMVEIKVQRPTQK